MTASTSLRTKNAFFRTSDIRFELVKRKQLKCCVANAFFNSNPDDLLGWLCNSCTKSDQGRKVMLPTSGFLPWVQVPSVGLVDALKAMSWNREGELSPAKDAAALMIYVVLLFISRQHSVERSFLSSLLGSDIDLKERAAEITYDGLEKITGLSRSLIRQGLVRLEFLRLIQPSGSRQKRRYRILESPGRWFKLPCRAVMTVDGVPAFKTFTLRSKHELNALKMYLYLADVRGRDLEYTEASYEKIYERLGIPERDIRRAINVLNTSGLLAQVNRESDRENSSWGPNKYFLKGYKDLYRFQQ